MIQPISSRDVDAPPVPGSSKLFSPYRVRGVTFDNRVLISPMSQYSALDGVTQDWHRDHIATLARGGAGAVIVEVAAVTRDGRTTHGDLGIWSDAHLPGLQSLAQTIGRNGAVPAIQIGHAGRKASCQRPWDGYGPLPFGSGVKVDADAAGDAAVQAAELPWPPRAASPLALTHAHPVPVALTHGEIDALVADFAAAARRAKEAGFRFVEIHAAHGYLLHGFLSPLANQREDAYGGSLENRMRFPLRVVEAVRAALGDELALSLRISAVDGIEEGWQIGDSVALATAAHALGVDIVDCSSGGIAGAATASSGPHAVRRGLGFQVPLAHAVRNDSGVPTIAVGLIVDPRQAEDVLAAQSADLIAIGRQALLEPNWPLHARHVLGDDTGYAAWPVQYGWWLARRPPITA